MAHLNIDFYSKSPRTAGGYKRSGYFLPLQNAGEADDAYFARLKTVIETGIASRHAEYILVVHRMSMGEFLLFDSRTQPIMEQAMEFITRRGLHEISEIAATGKFGAAADIETYMKDNPSESLGLKGILLSLGNGGPRLRSYIDSLCALSRRAAPSP